MIHAFIISMKIFSICFHFLKFMHNGDGRALPLYIYIYPIKYLYKHSLPYDSLLNNIIISISTLSILSGFSHI